MSNNNHLPAIIIPAYQRPYALRLLLDSLNAAHYPSSEIPLIISLEKDSTKEVIELAENFAFKSGTKTVIKSEKKLGLKNHILSCGDYSSEFDSVIVLEDDLMVAPGFYQFAKSALNFYQNNENIAGISLYSQRFNETALLPFEPQPSSWPVYFLQLASSWGEAWTSGQWSDFKSWLSNYEKSGNQKLAFMPENMQKWPANSWKKVFNQYLIERGKLFVYPYQSYITNNSGFGGTNIKKSAGNLLQVPISSHYGSGGANFSFPDFGKDSVFYDAFMEYKLPSDQTLSNILTKDIELDLYGQKTNAVLKTKKFFISPKTGPTPLLSFPLRMKPIELNIQLNVHFNETAFFHLYRSEHIDKLCPLTNYQYYQLAEHLSYLPFRTKKFIKGYAVAIFEKIKSRFMF
ncbi:MAG: hypothetical protein EA359_00065 [Balneolaceae bacterium]|nr:MAG: hypothetical protein EA359_00065 [Balneolaceae bacterium]